MTSGGSWFCAQGERDGKPLVIRGRDRLLDIASATSHRSLLRIVWDYEPEGEHGLPSANTSEQMSVFEEIIVEALEQSLLCVFFCVHLHNCRKEWLAYTSNVQEACDRINAALAGLDPHPIAISAEDDPMWQEYADLCRGVGIER